MELNLNLINKKMKENIMKKNFKNKSSTEKFIIKLKNLLVKNWYILLIIGFIFFILYLKYKDNKIENFKNEKEKEQNKKKIEPKNEENYFTKYYNFQTRYGPDYVNKFKV